MRKIAANYIFPVTGKPLKNGILTIDDNGYIIGLTDTGGKLQESERLEFYNGVLVPGFINTHCHLELSHLKDRISPHSHLDGFIKQVQQLRKVDEKEIIAAMRSACDEMSRNGIVAAGDISNSDSGFEIKATGKILFHTFIEIFGLSAEQADSIFDRAFRLLNNSHIDINRASIIPHSPYSVSENLFSRIHQYSERAGSILSIHNQESDEENELFGSKRGKLFELFSKMGIDFSNWRVTGLNSLQSVLKFLPAQNNVLLVHNTFSKQEDISAAINHSSRFYFVLCPNSNIFIENRLPDVPLFIKNKLNITIGTDSLASNRSLSVLEELKTLTNFYPEISLNDLVLWGTLNGAKALAIDTLFGSFDIGKKPGVNLLQNVDFEAMNLTHHSTVKVIL